MQIQNSVWTGVVFRRGALINIRFSLFAFWLNGPHCLPGPPPPHRRPGEDHPDSAGRARRSLTAWHPHGGDGPRAGPGRSGSPPSLGWDRAPPWAPALPTLPAPRRVPCPPAHPGPLILSPGRGFLHGPPDSAAHRIAQPGHLRRTLTLGEPRPRKRPPRTSARQALGLVPAAPPRLPRPGRDASARPARRCRPFCRGQIDPWV